MLETFFSSPLSFSTCSFFFALVTAMFEPFQILCARVGRAFLPALRGQDARAHTNYAFAAASIGAVSSAIPGPMDELR